MKSEESRRKRNWLEKKVELSYHSEKKKKKKKNSVPIHINY